MFDFLSFIGEIEGGEREAETPNNGVFNSGDSPSLYTLHTDFTPDVSFNLLWRGRLLRSPRVKKALLFNIFFLQILKFNLGFCVSSRVTQSATSSEIKKAYYKLSLKLYFHCSSLCFAFPYWIDGLIFIIFVIWFLVWCQASW